MSRRTLVTLAPRRFLLRLGAGFLLTLAALALQAAGVAPLQRPPVQQWSMGYYTPFDGPEHGPTLPPNAIEWGGLTHIIYLGGNIHADGTLDVETYSVPSKAPTLISHAHAHGVKAMLGLQQCNWCPGYRDTDIQTAVAIHLPLLVANIASVVTMYGFDGVDVDWEPYHSGSQSKLMFQLLAALRRELGSKVLTATAIFGDGENWGGGIGYLDRINLMTYDLAAPHYGGRHSWFHAALYGDPGGRSSTESVNDVATEFMAHIPAAKINIGIPFYGFSCNHVTGPRQSAGWSSANCTQIYYHHLADHGFDISNPNWDSSAQVPWVYQQGSWLNFENAQSVAAKINYAKSKGLGGWIIWELVGDYFPHQNPKQPLLKAIENSMRGVKAISDYTPTPVVPQKLSPASYPMTYPVRIMFPRCPSPGRNKTIALSAASYRLARFVLIQNRRSTNRLS